MSQTTLYLFVALGVAVSVILPLLRPFLPIPSVRDGYGSGPGGDKGPSKWKRFLHDLKPKMGAIWQASRPFVVLGIFSLIVALIIFAFLGDTLKTWQSAFLLGYTADSTLQKLVTNKQHAIIGGG